MDQISEPVAPIPLFGPLIISLIDSILDFIVPSLLSAIRLMS